MKTARANAAKDLYKALRNTPWPELWGSHAAAFNKEAPGSKARNAGLVRAVGVVFSESGPVSQKNEVASWLRSLLYDPDEKIRRYAMAALPKIGADAADEKALINLLLEAKPEARDKKFLARALDKIGGKATLDFVDELPGQTALKVRASVARGESPSQILLNEPINIFAGVRIHLRCRRGLERFVRGELESSNTKRGIFTFRNSNPGLVEIAPRSPFSLNEILSLRCFGTLAFVLGIIPKPEAEKVARLITAMPTRRILQSLTGGPVRYRLDFPSRGHQRGLIRDIANLAFAMDASLLNDARSAPWAVEIQPHDGEFSVELRPRFSPDPRFSYRKLDVPAASHPPLAACMARLAGVSGRDVVWDPFCGSGLELIERGMLGGVERIFGSDRSADAIAIAEANYAASGLRARANFFEGDFRHTGIPHNSLSQIITNPPMGRRVPIPDLQGLIRDLLDTAGKLLTPKGVLVFANPLPTRISNPLLKLDIAQRIDLGGFDVRLERYVKEHR